MTPCQYRKKNIIEQQIRDFTKDSLYSCSQASLNWLDNTGFISALILPSGIRVKACTAIITEFDFGATQSVRYSAYDYTVRSGKRHYRKNGYTFEVTAFRPSLTSDFVDVFALRAWCVL